MILLRTKQHKKCLYWCCVCIPSPWTLQVQAALIPRAVLEHTLSLSPMRWDSCDGRSRAAVSESINSESQDCGLPPDVFNHWNGHAITSISFPSWKCSVTFLFLTLFTLILFWPLLSLLFPSSVNTWRAVFLIEGGHTKLFQCGTILFFPNCKVASFACLSYMTKLRIRKLG